RGRRRMPRPRPRVNGISASAEAVETRNAHIFWWSDASSASRMPRRPKRFQPAGFKKSPQSLSRGKTTLSISATERPRRARKVAADEPAGPAPITATSKRFTAEPQAREDAERKQPQHLRRTDAGAAK